MILVNRKEPYITVISLNRPEKRNALTIELMEKLCHAIDETQRLPKQRVLILCGEGPVFCAGLDLLEASDPSKEQLSAEWVAKTLTTIACSSLITIAAVQGAALAGGAGLMSACDFVVADQATLFGYPEVRRGLVAAMVMPFLCRQLKRRDIGELLLLGELINAEKAKSLGLINRIATKDLLTDAKEIAALALKGAPEATIKTKRLIEELYPANFLLDLQKGIKIHQEARHFAEAKEGIAAFLERRDPNW